MCALQATLKTLPNLFTQQSNYKTERPLDGQSDISIFCPILDENQEKYIGMCKVLNSNKLAEKTYAQTTLMREVVNLSQINHPAVIRFKGFNMYNDRLLFNGPFDSETRNPDYYSSSEEEDEIKPTKPEKPLTDPIPTCPTIFLEPVRRTPNLQKLINNSFKNKDVQWNSTRTYICILGLTHAVFYLHAQNIMHRNLSPEVIFFDENFYPKILDFSTSRQTLKDDNQSEKVDTDMTALNVKNINYQAYEILEPNNSYDSSIDVFSLGRIIYALLAKSHPFLYDSNDRQNYPSTLLKQMLLDRFVIPTFDPIPEPYQDLLLGCWEANPSLRPKAYDIFHFFINNLELFKPDENVDMVEVRQYIELLKESEKTLPHSICYEEGAEYNYHEYLPKDNELPQTNNLSSQSQEIISKLEYFIHNNFIPIANDPPPLKLLYHLLTLPNISCPLGIITEFLSSDHFNNKLQTKDELAQKIINEYFKEPLSITSTEIKPETSGAYKFLDIINIPPTVTKIGAQAFYQCNCRIVYIPPTVQEIELQAFACCPNLQFVYIPKFSNLTTIGIRAFADCPQLRFFALPDKLRVLPDRAFENDSSLSTFKFNQIRQIGGLAFSKCKSLAKIIFPPTLESIGDYAFKEISSTAAVAVDGKTDTKIKYSKKSFPIKVKI